MVEPRLPVYGAVLTYLEPASAGGNPYRHAVARGVAVSDPGTGDLWISVMAGGQVDELIDLALVVEVYPPVPHDSSAVDGQVEMLRDALNTAVAAVAELDGDEAGRLLGTMLDTTAPVRHRLFQIARSDLVDGLSHVLGYLIDVQAHVDAGEVPAACAALLAAHAAMDDLSPRGDQKRAAR